MPRQNEYFDWIDREGLASSREHYDRQYDRFVPPEPQETTVTTKVDKKLTAKKIDNLIDQYHTKHGQNVQIDIFDI
jgi:hypothetical protein